MATLPKSSSNIPATQAKAQLLKLLDTVSTKRTTIVISKRGKPIARLVPMDDDPKIPLFGRMKGTMQISGDIVSPDPEAWNSEQ
ncbi:type II toxin-antitoxin system Phd/YefM family antitoxin [Edaphobacter dinghuensis]|uniref:Antitoxin n=1 Tax=Edaphobacter dinghuensis TaxID=1560005 RepID=A0A917HI54_9BACT|nr:type II toxin-antitoxin system Phd/YefM family antitoxin [Edaphobacter dinghuensis]GGG80274.1 antitoxin [Edaphobacter dinghuensis]